MTLTERLDARERQIVQMLSDGRRVDEIAAAMSLAPKTVWFRLRLIRERLGITLTSQLIRFWQEEHPPK